MEDHRVPDVVILAGGAGERLRDAVADRQKILAKVHGVPFIFYVFKQLSEAGIQRAVLCTGYQGAGVEREIGSRLFGIDVIYSREDSPLGTGGALRNSLPFLSSESVILMNGDSLCLCSVGELLAIHESRQAEITMTVSESADCSRFGRVIFDRQEIVTGFQEKSESAPGYINAGISVISRHLIDTIPNARASLENEIFPKWIGRRFYVFRTSALCYDIGTPESYRGAERLLPNFVPPVRK